MVLDYHLMERNMMLVLSHLQQERIEGEDVDVSPSFQRMLWID